MRKNRRGISLIALVITIVVVIILAAAVILTMSQGGIMDSAKKSKFFNDYRSIQEGVDIYSMSNIDISDPTKYVLPLKDKLTLEDKQEIIDKVPTLNAKIQELNPGKTINDIDLYYINDSQIGANNIPVNKADKGYIIDVATRQIYDYYGDFFAGLRWHTLDGGVSDVAKVPPKEDVQEMWDGWIKLTLYYPPGSTARQWRLGTEGEVRIDPMLMWQDYTGPITIPLDRVKDVWIKYKLDGKDVIIPPAGTLLVDIEPDKKGSTLVDKVNVKINYDEEATIKEYRIGDSGWMTYTGPFDITENCMIEARAKKTESIYDTNGNLLANRDIAGRDLVYIGNIGIEETQLPAPMITRLDPIGSEKARVQVVYPAEAVKKIYKVNYGIEENYTSEINVNAWGTYIIAYYYDATGKRSQASAIRINNPDISAPEPPGPYDPKPPYKPGDPKPTDPYNEIPAPTISVNPTTLVEEVQVGVDSPASANKVYIKLGRYADYQLYTAPVTVRQNMEVYAYYVTYTGEKSNVGYDLVSNIKKNGKPYVAIDAQVYPWSGTYGQSDVTVTVKYSDANTIEYSEDGVVYQPYTAPFKVTQNKRIYARGTNANGTTETYLDITNIGKLTPPPVIQNLLVNINVDPEPSLATTRSAKARVSIEYDSKATEKYYTIGRYGTLQTYTGPFDVTSSCTIYAYAKATNAKGQAVKRIDNVSNGIADPIIYASPSNGTQAYKVAVSIEYDKYAKVKRYSVDGGPLRDYSVPFEVTTNGSVVYAYSENDVGQKAETSYTIENIVPEPPTLLLDMGSYYILKLNYPPKSRNREYKWKVDGEWKSYKETGILLIKPQHKNELIQNGTLVKIQDETGKTVTWSGDYYLIDVPISELFENLFMRWDRVTPPTPQILINPTEAAKQVTATIVYNDILVKKQYRVVKPGETPGDWKDYTGPITIDKNNTVIYAKGMDETEVWSAEGMYKVTNIDENPPVLTVTADLVTPGQKIAIKVSATDDVAVGKVKWAPGTLGESYFATGGTEIANNSIVNITSNGYYTFYAEDKVGNKQVYTLNVTNVDLTPPDINISVSPENTVGTSANVTIDYGDSTIKQYKVGTSNATWSNYTNTFAISSYTILANNWQNTDGTVTIYAKGKDKAGNEITVQKKIMNLDLDKPNAPIIFSNSSYATLTSYGAVFDDTTTITYDSRTDINNYYSIDNGVTWIPYTGQFHVASGTIIAKSVKKTTGLEVSVSQTIAMPSDALAPQAYDGNDATAESRTDVNLYMQVDSSMEGSNIRVKGYVQYSTFALTFLDGNKNVISTYSRGSSMDEITTIPAGTKWIMYRGSSSYPYFSKVYEIQPSNEPTFNATNGYMLLTADPTKAIKEPYQMITVKYFPTSVQRLYRIGTTGEWLNYQDQPIKVVQGQTIYAKGIDQYGKETRVVSGLTANVTDAITKEAYDGNDSTAESRTDVNLYMQVDSSMSGKNIRVKGYVQYSTFVLTFLDGNKNAISTYSRGSAMDEITTIPTGTKWIMYRGSSSYPYFPRLYEIQPSNEPTFSATNGYMLLTADPTKAIKEPYQMVTISYFATSVQRLYRIGTTSEWLIYQDQPIWVKQGQTIYAKGIDQYGNETRITSGYTVNVLDAILSEAYDNNDVTAETRADVNLYMQVDNSMQGKNIRVKGYVQYSTFTLTFLDSNKNAISTYSRGAAMDEVTTIPVGTKWIMYKGSSSYPYFPKLYEIQPSNEPTFTATNGYMLLTADPAKAIKEPYQMISISYFPTSVQRLYRIGATSEWLSYQNQPIWVNQGQTIYAKGIDVYGNDTRIVSSLTASVPDAIVKEGFDGNDSTAEARTDVNLYMQVDNSMSGKSIRVKGYVQYSTLALTFLDSNKNVISTYSRGSAMDEITTIPVGTKWIMYRGNSSYPYFPRLYEIQPSNVPSIIVSPTTPTNASVTVTLRSLYATDTIKYSFDSITWNIYTSPLIVSVNTTVYAKTIDISATEYNSSVTVNNIDKTAPTVAFGTNGAASVMTASTKVTISDTGTAGINASSLQYIWDTQNSAAPGSGWATFTNAATLTKGSVDGTYYLWIKASDNAGNSVTSCSNSFGIDNTVPGNPTLDATPTTLTNGNVTVTITYPADAATKQYSTNGTSWSAYTAPLAITANVTVYARAIDAAGNQSAQSTITIANIDKTGPVPTFGTNGGSNIKVATTTVNVTDAPAGLNESTLQYVWSTSTTAPATGWISFTNGDTLSQGTVTGAYYLWIKATDNLGNVSSTRSNVFNIDNTAPTVPTISTVYAPDTMTNCTVTVTYPSDASLKQYSYDGTNWQTYTAALNITTDSTVYVRATDAAGNISGVGSRNIYILGVGYIPKMTSNIAPSPYEITVSSTYTAGYEGYRAFDKTLSTYGWATLANDINDGNSWIQIKLDSAKTVSKYYIIARNDAAPEQTPKSWQLQGSNDGSSWNILDNQTDQINWSLGELRVYNVNNSTPYQYYRLYVTANNVSPYVTIDEMDLYQ